MLGHSVPVLRQGGTVLRLLGWIVLGQLGTMSGLCWHNTGTVGTVLGQSGTVRIVLGHSGMVLGLLGIVLGRCWAGWERTAPVGASSRAGSGEGRDGGSSASASPAPSGEPTEDTLNPGALARLPTPGFPAAPRPLGGRRGRSERGRAGLRSWSGALRAALPGLLAATRRLWPCSPVIRGCRAAAFNVSASPHLFHVKINV